MIKLDFMCKYPNNKIVIYASKLAACVGYNKYVDPIVFKNQYQYAMNMTDKMPVDEDYKEYMKLPEPIRTNINQIIDTKYATTSDSVAKCDEICATIPVAAANHVKHEMYCNQGNQKEAEIAERIVAIAAATMDIPVSGADAPRAPKIIHSKFTCSSKPIVIVNGQKIYIGGKHDGIIDGKLYEIKCRQKRFMGIPEYEKVQMYAYMVIFNINKCTLVESFQGQEQMHEIDFDPVYWNKIKMHLREFIESLSVLPDGVDRVPTIESAFGSKY
jgi:hypothetical protein